MKQPLQYTCPLWSLPLSFFMQEVRLDRATPTQLPRPCVMLVPVLGQIHIVTSLNPRCFISLPSGGYVGRELLRGLDC